MPLLVCGFYERLGYSSLLSFRVLKLRFMALQFCDDPLIVNLGLCKETQTGDCFGTLWMRDFEGGEDVSTFRTTVRSQSCSSRPETSPREHLEMFDRHHKRPSACTSLEVMSRSDIAKRWMTVPPQSSWLRN
ncbi:hypothetical protein R1flu_024066 [Riccia fluitans]|uniref:Uncharacterized protein n=1 Tax=Riccia fluitans TaxID=41844 RepID=A0ABD1XUA2_9MARC